MDQPGQPTLYREEFAEQADELCLAGAINDELAEAFGVAPRTIDRWLKVQPDFAAAVRRGRLIADGKIARALYRRAFGYTYRANKVIVYPEGPMVVPYEVHCPPDVRAMTFWLRNRRPKQWREDRRLQEKQADRRNWWPGAEQAVETAPTVKLSRNIEGEGCSDAPEAADLLSNGQKSLALASAPDQSRSCDFSPARP